MAMIVPFWVVLVFSYCIGHGHVWASRDYLVTSLDDGCTFNKDFIESVICSTKHLNWSIVNTTFAVQLKPNVKITSLYVCIPLL